MGVKKEDKDKTPLQKLEEITGNRDKAKFIKWYCEPEANEETYKEWWGNLNHKKWETVMEWLDEEKVQEGMKYWMNVVKNRHLFKIYKNQVSNALKGDTKSCDWVANFSKSEFFDNTDNEAKEWLAKRRNKLKQKMRAGE